MYRDPVEYSYKTTTGVLRAHISKFHEYEYLEACSTNGWPVKIKSLSRGGSSSSSSAGPPRPSFTLARFKHALVNWVVADDQVCKLQQIYVTVC